MYFPRFFKEKQIFLKGYTSVVGLDEAGRGSLAGPLIAGAVRLSVTKFKKIANKPQRLIADSKILSPKRRKQAYNYIIETFEYSFGIVDNNFIDRFGVSRAVQTAMNAALKKLDGSSTFVISDGGNFHFDQPYEVLTDADYFIFTVAAASIVAKVTRDDMFLEFDRDYFGYGFSQHKGYGTKKHFLALKKYGPSMIHRRSFSPVSSMV